MLLTDQTNKTQPLCFFKFQPKSSNYRSSTNPEENPIQVTICASLSFRFGLIKPPNHYRSRFSTMGLKREIKMMREREREREERRPDIKSLNRESLKDLGFWPVVVIVVVNVQPVIWVFGCQMRWQWLEPGDKA